MIRNTAYTELSNIVLGTSMVHLGLFLFWLVVEPYPSEKYEFVSWDYYSQYMEK
jgi:hypothetical protein